MAIWGSLAGWLDGKVKVCMVVGWLAVQNLAAVFMKPPIPFRPSSSHSIPFHTSPSADPWKPSQPAKSIAIALH